MYAIAGIMIGREFDVSEVIRDNPFGSLLGHRTEYR